MNKIEETNYKRTKREQRQFLLRCYLWYIIIIIIYIKWLYILRYQWIYILKTCVQIYIDILVKEFTFKISFYRRLQNCL